MAEYRSEERTGYTADGRPVTTVVERRGGGIGSIIGIVLLLAAVVVAILFATGFWKADVTREGSLPKVSVSGGELPKVDVKSKEIVVGTTKTDIDVPKIKTEKKEVDVPTVGVKDGDQK